MVLLLVCGLLGLGSRGRGESPVAAAPVPATLSLEQCLQIALDHNPQMRTASQQFLAAEGKSISLHAILYPTVNAQALSAPTTFYVQINQELYDRAMFPQLRISRLARDQAVINYRQTLTDVVFQVRQAFYTALGAGRRLELVQAFRTGQAHSLASAQQLFQGGKIQKSAVLSVQVTGNLAEQSQTSNQLNVAQAKLALNELLGEELPENVRLVGDLTTHVSTSLDPSALTAEALRDRADLKLLESLRLTQQQEILVDQKNALPILGASSDSAIQPPAFGPTSDFDLERNYDEPEVQRNAGNTQLPFSLYFTWLIFDGGALAGLHASDQAQLETQEVAINALRHSIPGEVAVAVAAIRTEQASLQTLDAGTSPDEVRHSAELDYEAGRIRQLDLINLESDLLNQQELHLASEVRLNLAVAALDRALGRGLLTRLVPSPAPHP